MDRLSRLPFRLFPKKVILCRCFSPRASGRSLLVCDSFRALPPHHALYGVLQARQHTTNTHVSAVHSSWTSQARSALGVELRWPLVNIQSDTRTKALCYLWLITRFKNKAVAFYQRPWQPHGRCTQTDAFVRWGMAVACNRYKSSL